VKLAMIAVGTPVADLDTPVQVVDLDKMEANIRAMQAAIDAAGARSRPHIKTHKIPEIARLQEAAGAKGIAVAKVAEAEVFAAAGFADIAVAYPVVGPEKWRRLAALARTCRVTVNVDSAFAVRGLSEAAKAAGTTIFVQIDIDTGFHRCGVQPNDAEELCRLVLQMPGLELDGMTTHRSVFFPDNAGRPATELGREEGEIMVALADRLRASGIPIREVTAGSTPTASAAAAVPGVTEVRAGTYVFGDLIMAGVGAMRRQDLALSIITTVQSRPTPQRATVDGGMKTFMGEAFPSPPKSLQGFGEAVDLPIHLEGLTEEHGLVALTPEVQPQLGDRIAFYPNHVCTTVNLSDVVVGQRNGRVEVVWPVAARGKRT
jgi:D-serine deaminase-like pyridoxal phosphate-dependent protein